MHPQCAEEALFELVASLARGDVVSAHFCVELVAQGMVACLMQMHVLGLRGREIVVFWERDCARNVVLMECLVHALLQRGYRHRATAPPTAPR